MKKFVLLLVLLSMTAIAALPASAQDACRDINGRLILSTTNFSTGLDDVAFDPQPEPPGTIRGFNPQPDPPRLVNGAPTTGYEAVAFNPQPDPPHDPLLNGCAMPLGR